ncbi:MAG: type III pantothenate kinase [Dictyoglomi bacterium]|nr:type III pantothenate kinase [Dictyoglomota bacterium]HHV81881.1 type III pantothenate kinase [bacterium]HOK29197.1 type III pantothenate kinase [bacterium]HOL54529.1 type III pantothenate kinase [bacterium]HPO81562.1 type III pantothenate kinase [bacterium]
MIIAIDVGNTNIDVAFFQGYKLLRHFEFSTNRQATSYEYAINLSWLINNNGLKADDVEGAALASVVPPVTVELERAIRYLFDIKPFIVVPGIRTGLIIDVENPKEVGADIICNAVSLVEDYRSSGIVIDFGTAITVLGVKERKLLGVAIAPGIWTASSALWERAAKLSPIDIFNPPESVLGKNTVTAMQSGIIYGFIGLVDKLVSLELEEMEIEPFVVATGGWSERIARYCNTINLVDPYLTLRGLCRLYMKNI